jgi:hypothetical protein
MVDIESDAVQFMLFTPLPVTGLYDRLKKKGLLKEELAFEEWHGQKMLNWNHHAFPGDLAKKTLDSAFKMEFEANSSTIYRIIETAVRGYENNLKRAHTSANYKARVEQLRKRVLKYSALLPVIKVHAVNDKERQRAIELRKRVKALVGTPGTRDKLLSIAALVLSVYWKLRLRLKGHTIQPKTIFAEFRATNQLSLKTSTS